MEKIIEFLVVLVGVILFVLFLIAVVLLFGNDEDDYTGNSNDGIF